MQGENADKLAARLICPGANNAVAPEAEPILLKRGIWSIPYFVANCGGVLGNRLEVLNTDEMFIESFFRQLNHSRITDLMKTSQRTGEPMAPSLRKRLYTSAVRVYNAGFVPEALVRPFAPAYFRKTILDPVLADSRAA